MNYGMPYAGRPAFANPFLPPFTPGYGMTVFGQDPAATNPPATPPPTQSFWDKTKATLGAQNSIVPVKNGYLLGGAAALGLIIYGSAEGWFGGKHHASHDQSRRRRHR